MKFPLRNSIQAQTREEEDDDDDCSGRDSNHSDESDTTTTKANQFRGNRVRQTHPMFHSRTFFFLLSRSYSPATKPSK
jgi:hypothetical protein